MSELDDILQAARALTASTVPFALASVVAVRGSTYRLPGAKQLIAPGHPSVGTVSGGCLDTDLSRLASEVIDSGVAVHVTYDLTAEDDAVWGFGLGCNGATEIFLEPGGSAVGYIEALHGAHEGGRPLAIVTVVEAGITDRKIGARLFVEADGSVHGSLGDSEADGVAAAAGRESISRGRYGTVHLPGDGSAFVEVIAPPPRLILCGAGHDAVPLAEFGAQLGWRVVVVDERSALLTPERFPGAVDLVAGPARTVAHLDLDGRTDVVVMSHTYLRDVEYLRAILGSAVRYIGMLGPRDRTGRILADLAAAETPPTEEDIAKLHAPAGLDIGAESPAEIAWSIMAEIIAVSRSRAGGRLRDRSGAIHGDLDPVEIQSLR